MLQQLWRGVTDSYTDRCQAEEVLVSPPAVGVMGVRATRLTARHAQVNQPDRAARERARRAWAVRHERDRDLDGLTGRRCGASRCLRRYRAGQGRALIERVHDVRWAGRA